MFFGKCFLVDLHELADKNDWNSLKEIFFGAPREMIYAFFPGYFSFSNILVSSACFQKFIIFCIKFKVKQGRCF